MAELSLNPDPGDAEDTERNSGHLLPGGRTQLNTSTFHVCKLNFSSTWGRLNDFYIHWKMERKIFQGDNVFLSSYF